MQRSATILVLALLSAPLRAETAPSFELDIQPVLTSLGCNAGACHGKARGQNGFALSLLGFDPDFDFNAMTKEGRGRRIFPASPDNSLLLLKATGTLLHGGGIRMEKGDANYELLRKWIAKGSPRRIDGEPTLAQVSVRAPSRHSGAETASVKHATVAPRDEIVLEVTAHYSDGSTRNVTNLTAFQSSDSAVASVSDKGAITISTIPGESVIMARYMHRLDTFTVTSPLPGAVPSLVYEKLPRNNFIDEHIWAKLKSLGITPSQPVDDAKFMRRAYIDIIGRLPTIEEARAFLSDEAKDKRARLVDVLLARPEYADHWANKWADLLRPNPYRVGIKAVFNYDNWIRQSFRDNKPYDQFVTELVTAKGSTWDNGATVLYRDRRSPDEITTLVSQLFLGVRLECAKCHQHPFEKWSQHDFYSFAAYFAKTKHKGTGLSPPISGGEEVVYAAHAGDVEHPITGEKLDPAPLFGEAPKIEGSDDPREALAAWMTSKDNDYFAMVAVNRVWADLMGRPLVDPVDDLRITNPPTNEPLLRALAQHYREVKFDQKKLIRTIVLSQAYSLSSIPTDRNVADTRYHSRHYRTRLRAEVLLDSVSDITGVRDSFEAMPPGARATQLWTHRSDSLTLDTFGRPDPNQDPPCERLEDPTVTQALHLMMSPQLHGKVHSDRSWAAKLAASKATPGAIVEQLYLAVFSRYPTQCEKGVLAGVFGQEGASRRQVTEDILWSMVNSPEFYFKD